MTIKEMLAAKKAELATAQKSIEAGEAVENIDELIAEVEELGQKAAKAAKAKETIDALGGVKTERTENFKTLGEFAAKHIAGKAEKGGRGSWKTPLFKASTDVQTIPAGVKPALTDYDRNVVGIRKPLGLADLFGTETITGNALTYFVEGSVEGSVTAVAENGAKPQIHFADPTPKTVSLTKLAAFYKESDEMLEDASWLASSINNRAVYLLNVKEENTLLTTLSGTSGLGTLAKGGTDLAIDDIKKAKTAVMTATGFNADAVVVNPADYDKIVLASLNTHYFVNPWAAEEPRLWGMAVYQSSDVTAGTCIVGAFKQGASVIRKDGVSVEMVNTNEDDFINNRVTVRVEERLALAVRYPGAFVKVS